TRAAFGSCTSAGSPGCAVAYAQDFAPDDGSLDDNGHGTNVAGIGLSVAPATKILSLDVFRTDDGQHWYYNDNDVMSALNWVIANQAAYNIRATNMSLGVQPSHNTTECSDSPYSAPFLIARGVGVLPVVA